MANCQNNMYYGRQGSQNNGNGYRNNRMPCNTNTARQATGRTGSESCSNTNYRTAYTGRESQSCGCGCEKPKDPLSGLALAMAYVPWQKWGNLYDACQALQQGTVFEALDKPFLGRGGCNR